MAGRHRKVSPVRQRAARLTAVLSLTSATGLPAAAMLSHAAADSPHVQAGAERARPVQRAAAHAVSRSADRVVPLNLTDARQAAAAQQREALARAARKAEQARKAREAKRREAREAKRRGFLAGPGDLPDGVSFAPCPDGSAIESGLTTNAIKVYRAVCNAFPAISSWGGRSGRGEHAAGRALDIMISGDAGWRLAEYVRRHAGALGVSEVIYAQRIWTVERSGEGWRPMEDRGSTTANHYDHVHVTTY